MPNTMIGNALLQYLKSKDLLKGIDAESEEKLESVLIDFFEIIIGAIISTKIGKLV